MSMKLGYDLTIEQTQKLVMTPDLIQAIKILQLNTQELDTYIQDQVMSNPVLEVGEDDAPSKDQEHEDFSDKVEEVRSSDKDDFDWEEYIKNRQYDDISYQSSSYAKEEGGEFDYERFVQSDTTLSEHLLQQLQFVKCSEHVGRVVRYIIESLDDNGYMTSTSEEILLATGEEEEVIERALEIVHSFDPAGVGASDLKECLIIQLKQKGKLTELLETVIRDHIEDMANNRFAVISKKTGIPSSGVQELADTIRSLEPKPGRQFASAGETKYIVPDVKVEKIDGRYEVTVNDDSIPELKVSSYYRDLLKDTAKDDSLSKYLSGRINSAIWLIKSIEQRKSTIKNVVESVVKFQMDFFEEGPKHLKTLTLKDVANDIGVHESTVSRSINGKYLECARGIFEIRYFFKAGCGSRKGDGISSNSIKEFIREIIEKEDPASPVSDQAVADLLRKEEGITISRRTVAKYRDEMEIPSSSRRRRY